VTTKEDRERLQERFRDIMPQLTVFADEMDAFGKVDDRARAAQAQLEGALTRLRDVQAQCAAEEEKFNQQVAAHQRALADLEGAKLTSARELKHLQDAVKAAQAQLAELRSQVNSANYHRERALESIQALTKQINGAA
jgi:chromosome segregation ATPase